MFKILHFNFNSATHVGRNNLKNFSHDNRTKLRPPTDIVTTNREDV